MKSITLVLLLLTGLLPLSGYSAIEVPAEVKAIPVQYEGRVMPFESFAREQILSVTGKLSLKGESPTETVLGWMANPSYAAGIEIFEVGFQPMLTEVGLDPKKHKWSLDQLLAARKIMQLGNEAHELKQREEKPTKIQSEAGKALGKMGSHYALLTSQVPAFFPSSAESELPWMSLADTTAINDSISAGIHLGVLGLISAYKAGNTKQMADIATELTRIVKGRWNPGASAKKSYDYEVLYNKILPIKLGRWLYMIALILLLGSIVGSAGLLQRVAHFAVYLGLTAHLGALYLRTIIGQRAPWSNFYESLITIVAVTVILGLVYSRGRIKPLLLAGTAFVGYASLLIADNSGLTPGVDTLVPALQSYWLNIHVIVILAGYAAATLAMVLGHVALGVEVFKPKDKELFTISTKAVYRSVQIAMLLLFAGTILGGVWAHEAWGRYWGWDPKETWALISWFAYLGVAHARFAGWLSPRGLAVAAIGVYPIILMCYYGVNYLLSGLHSYAGGESASVPPLLAGFVIFELALAAFCGYGLHMKFFSSKPTPPSGPVANSESAA